MTDYTQMEEGTKVEGRRVDVCPKCGKKGLVVARAGDFHGAIIHASEKKIGLSVASQVCYLPGAGADA